MKLLKEVICHGVEEIFEEIMVEIFSKLMIDINLQIQEAQEIPSRKIKTERLENNSILVGRGMTGIKAV